MVFVALLHTGVAIPPGGGWFDLQLCKIINLLRSRFLIICNSRTGSAVNTHTMPSIDSIIHVGTYTNNSVLAHDPKVRAVVRDVCCDENMPDREFLFLLFSFSPFRISLSC